MLAKSENRSGRARRFCLLGFIISKIFGSYMKNVIYQQKERQLQLEELCGEILANARNELYLNMRFLSAALYSLRFVADLELRPLGTDGQDLYFSPEALTQMFRSERKLVNRAYMHVLMHCLFCHPFVRPADPGKKDELPSGQDVQEEEMDGHGAQTSSDDLNDILIQTERQQEEERWNLACDIAVEYLLDGLYLPCLHLRKSSLRLSVYQELDKALKVVTAQGVYHWLSSGGFHISVSDLEREFSVDDHRLWASIPPKKRKQMQNHWEDIRKKMQTEMETFSQEAADGTKGLYDQVKVENRRRYDYRSFLRKFSVLREEMEIDADSFDYIFYHYGMQMYGNMPLIEPQETKEVSRIEEFVIVIDTSMSCKGELVKHFLEETYSILMQQETYARKFHIRLIQCDEKVQNDHLITSQEELKSYIEDFTVIGQGGTDFRPAFSYVNHLVKTGVFHRLRGLLYFTDGYGIYPVKKPVYDTAFLFMKDDYSDADVPPWAIKIMLDPLEWGESRILPAKRAAHAAAGTGIRQTE